MIEKRQVKEMTTKEKAVETRRQHKEAQEARRQEWKLIREKMKESCLRILDDPSSSSADQMKAVEILHELMKGR